MRGPSTLIQCSSTQYRYCVYQYWQVLVAIKVQVYQDTDWVHLKFSLRPHTQDQEKENREKLFDNLFLRFCLLHSYCLQNKKLSDSGPKTLSLSDMRLWRTSFRIVQSNASELQLEI